MIIGGMDTDASGAFVGIDTNDNSLLLYRFPNKKHVSSGRLTIDTNKALFDLARMQNMCDVLLVEEQIGRPTIANGKKVQSTKNIFNFGATFGHCETIANFISPDLRYMPASVWKPKMRCAKVNATTSAEIKDIKKIARRVASEILQGNEEIQKHWKLVKNTSVCEAFLMAILMAQMVNPLDYDKPFKVKWANI